MGQKPLVEYCGGGSNILSKYVNTVRLALMKGSCLVRSGVGCCCCCCCSSSGCWLTNSGAAPAGSAHGEAHPPYRSELGALFSSPVLSEQVHSLVGRSRFIGLFVAGAITLLLLLLVGKQYWQRCKSFFPLPFSPPSSFPRLATTRTD